MENTKSNNVLTSSLWRGYARFLWGVHDNVIKWKHFPRYWPFVRGLNRSPVNSHGKGQWPGTLKFSLICAWTNGWANHRDAGYWETMIVVIGLAASMPHGYVALAACNSYMSESWMFHGHFLSAGRSQVTQQVCPLKQHEFEIHRTFMVWIFIAIFKLVYVWSQLVVTYAPALLIWLYKWMRPI